MWIVEAQHEDRRRFIVCADEKLSAFAELERQVLTVKRASRRKVFGCACR